MRSLRKSTEFFVGRESLTRDTRSEARSWIIWSSSDCSRASSSGPNMAAEKNLASLIHC